MACACKTRYTPPVLSTNKNYLVIDGFIVPGNDSTVILLSRATNVTDTVIPHPETGAHIQVVGESNDAHELVEERPGRYISTGLNLNSSQQYKLTIATTNGQQYQSDFVPVKQSPGIDSVSWNRDTAGNVQVYADTHDPAGNAQYYKWDYIETWQYRSSYNSFFDWQNNQLVLRTAEEHVYDCYKNNFSPGVNIATTKLKADVVYRQPVVQVVKGTQKISVKYSVLVKQYVLTKEAYLFWESVKNATEQQGSIFDLQPSQLQSNIHCDNDPAQVVIGFVSASSRQQKRLFISLDDVPDWGYLPYYTGFECTGKSVLPSEMPAYFPPVGPYFWTVVGSNMGRLVIEKITCVDCRENGGTNVKPLFWP